MIRWLLKRWHERQRALDIQLLWPTCRDLGKDLDQARVAFALHASYDPAWTCLSEAEIARIIEGLQ